MKVLLFGVDNDSCYGGIEDLINYFESEDEAREWVKKIKNTEDRFDRYQIFNIETKLSYEFCGEDL